MKEKELPSKKPKAPNPARPGHVIKQVLLGEIPLANRETVTQASITDLHNAYKALIDAQNQIRLKDDCLKGMTSSSFHTLFRFARLLEFVEHVKDEPRREPAGGKPVSGKLHRVERVEENDGLCIVESNRKIYQLTQKGRDATEDWDDLCSAWRRARGTIGQRGRSPRGL